MPTRIQFRRDTAANWASANPALAAGELGYDTTNGRFKIGNGNTTWNSLPYTTNAETDSAFTTFASRGGEWKRIRHATGFSGPKGFLRFVSAKFSGTHFFSVKSSTGYAAALWWDGTVTINGTGSTTSSITLAKSVPTSGNWSGASPKEIHIWPCASASSALGVSGSNITELSANSQNLYVAELGGMNLSVISMQSNYLRFFDASDCSNLTTLYLTASPLEELDLTGCNSLTSLFLSSTLLSGTFDATPLSSLGTLLLNSSNGLTGIRLGSLSSLQSLIFQGNENLVDLDLSSLPSLANVTVNNCHALESVYINSGSTLTGLYLQYNNSLASVRCPGAVFGGYYSSYYIAYGANLASGNLSATALNQFYTDLGTPGGSGGYINVDNNPGVSSDDPSIATAKGYTVYGT